MRTAIVQVPYFILDTYTGQFALPLNYGSCRAAFQAFSSDGRSP